MSTGYSTVVICVVISLAVVCSGCEPATSDRSGYAVNTGEKASPEDAATASLEPAAGKIAEGTSMSTALQVLSDAGVNQEQAFAVAGGDPTVDVMWRIVSDGVTVAIYYGRSSQKITALQMWYVPPEYTKGNVRILDARSLEFHDDGSYSVRFVGP